MADRITPDKRHTSGRRSRHRRFKSVVANCDVRRAVPHGERRVRAGCPARPIRALRPMLHQTRLDRVAVPNTRHSKRRSVDGPLVPPGESPRAPTRTRAMTARNDVDWRNSRAPAPSQPVILVFRSNCHQTSSHPSYNNASWLASCCCRRCQGAFSCVPARSVRSTEMGPTCRVPLSQQNPSPTSLFRGCLPGDLLRGPSSGEQEGL
jgi:hypothetical protein